MVSMHPVSSFSRRAMLAGSTLVIAAASLSGAGSSSATPTATPTAPTTPTPILVGRAVLPAATFATGPPAGAFVVPGPGIVNGVSFPLPAQPVEGFSAIVDGRRPGEYLAMADNGFGSKANSRDFLIRAYYIKPHFKTAQGGSGSVDVKGFVSFRDPDGVIGFPIVNEGSAGRLLTGGDIDPESIQIGRRGDLWVGDEFGPWILHFNRHGRLLDPPSAMPAGIVSPNNPLLNGQPHTHPNSRGIEGMAISPDRRFLYAALEGPTLVDPDQSRRLVFEFNTVTASFTGRVLNYRTEAAGQLVADMWALDRHRMVVIERDLGSGASALFRKVYLVDRRRTDAAGFLVKTELIDLASIADPDLVSLPALHAGDLGLGNPYWVMCESVEAVHAVSKRQLMIGCDNNLPNSGRNPGLPDDNEFIVVDVPRLTARH